MYRKYVYACGSCFSLLLRSTNILRIKKKSKQNEKITKKL